MASTMTNRPTPPNPVQQQDQVPGREGPMDPKPDHGEKSYKGSGRLAGKKAIITGGDSRHRPGRRHRVRAGGGGRADRLPRRGRRRPRDGRVGREGRAARPSLFRGDIADAGQCRALVQKAVEAFGRIDVLVNNAAFQMTHESLDEISDEEWDKTFDVEHRRDVPHHQGGGAAHEAGRRDHQHDVGQRRHAQADAAGLRDDQGRDPELHRRAGAAAGRQGHPRQLRRARPDLDAADPRDDAAGAGEELRLQRAR